MVEIRCSYSRLVELSALTPHPDNPNYHSPEQIKALADIIKFQGVRHPIKVSKRSGFITSGHGRLMAAQLLKMKNFPVDEQEYDSESQEYADVVADNAIAEWSKLDLSSINKRLKELPSLKIDFLGLQHLSINVPDFKIGEEKDQGKLDVSMASGSANVKSLELTFDLATHEEFMMKAKALGNKFSTENISDTIMACVRLVHDE